MAPFQLPFNDPFFMFFSAGPLRGIWKESMALMTVTGVTPIS